MKKEYSYERRIVCFIDILGFSKLVKGTVNNDIGGKEKLINICCALDRIDGYLCTMNKEISLNDIQTTQFSDSVVISFSLDETSNEILSVFTWIKYMQVFMIKEYNVLLRGGIVIGDVIHNEKMVVGPAMIDAYTLEAKHAIYPRIIIDSPVTLLFEKTLDRYRGDSRYYDTTLIRKDLDGISYIDYFIFPDIKEFLSSPFMNDYLNQLQLLIDMNINNENKRIREKYLWISDKIRTSNIIKC